jgi:hypothetical protein
MIEYSFLDRRLSWVALLVGLSIIAVCNPGRGQEQIPCRVLAGLGKRIQKCPPLTDTIFSQILPCPTTVQTDLAVSVLRPWR